MNSLLATPSPPHHLHNPRLSPSRSMSFSNPIPSRKRKAEDDEPNDESISQSTTHSIRPISTPQRPSHKRSRTDPLGRPLSLNRLLETLDANSLRGVLSQLCSNHPSLAQEVETISPRPSVPSALAVLESYESTLQSSFPFGGDRTSDYAYNRVRQPLQHLLDALADYVPHFLPPNESRVSHSLNFLDGATEIIHRLPGWQNFQNNLQKQEAYEEIDKAWAVVIGEASSRAGGMQLKYEGWEEKLGKHDEKSGGRLREAKQEMGKAVGWIGAGQTGQAPRSDELSAVRQELLSGNYGFGVQLRVGPW